VISVVIPARNAGRELPATLRALAAQEVGEVIVADNGSSDATADVARSHGATVVTVDRASRPAARNRGAAAARGEVLLFTDAGCVPDPGWAGALEACLRDAPLAGGPVRVTTGPDPSPVERFDVLWRFQQERAVREGGWTAGANLGIARDAFERVGGFDESYTAGDDVDLCVRARRAGFELAWCPDAGVTHPASATLRTAGRRALRQGFSSTRLARSFGDVGRRHWRRPGGIVRGRAALRALGVDVDALDPAERRRMAMLARFDYAARFAGSAWAELTRAGS
jgi:GT2 family glycosyltransferase